MSESAIAVSTAEDDAAHLERGYTRIANRLLEAILAASFSSCQLRAVMALARMTYGWNRKNVTVSGRELASRAGLSYTGRFREAIGELVKERVLTMTSEGQSKPNLYGIQKVYGQWGRFASSRDNLRRRWDSDHAGIARNSQPSKGAAKQACPKTGMPPARQQGCLQRGSPRGDKPARDIALGGGKDSKDIPTLGLEKKGGEKGPNWVADFAEDWRTIQNGVPDFGKIGAQLKPLFEEPMNLAPVDVRPHWQAFLHSADGRFGPKHFAANYGRYSKTHSGRAQQLARDGYT